MATKRSGTKNRGGTKIFVNLPVKNLKKTMNFFSKLGFKFEPKFTDKKAACMVINDDIYAMLVVEKFFKTFTKKGIVDAEKKTEVLLALSAESRAKVDQMTKKAIEAGGIEPRAPQDHGWMYGRNFQDLDGHLWEIIYMDEASYVKT